MAASATEINKTAKLVLKKNGFEKSQPPAEGMQRSALMREVVAALVQAGKISDSEVDENCVVEVMGILLGRYDKKLASEGRAAIRRLKPRFQYWLKKEEVDENAETADLLPCG